MAQAGLTRAVVEQGAAQLTQRARGAHHAQICHQQSARRLAGACVEREGSQEQLLLAHERLLLLPVPAAVAQHAFSS